MYKPKEVIMKKIVVANKKGGVGKTTTVHNLAFALGQMGYKVLMLDMDAQANLTTACGISAENSILDVMRKRKTFNEVAIKVFENKDERGCVYLIPALRELAAMGEIFANDFGKEMLLKECLEQVNTFDYVLIDSPPSLDLIAVNTYTAGDYIVIPVQCEFFSLEGLALMANDLERVKTRLNPSLEILAIVPTFYDKRKRICRDVVGLLHEQHKELVTSTYIRDNVALAEAPSNGESIFQYDSSCYGSTDYRKLAEEIIKKLEVKNA